MPQSTQLQSGNYKSLILNYVFKLNIFCKIKYFSPRAKHILLGGGQDAKDVTTTAIRDGKFDARFYHMLLEEEFGRVKGHFGPINTLAFHPDGKAYCSGI